MLTNIIQDSKYYYSTVNPQAEADADQRRERKGKEQYSDNVYLSNTNRDNHPPRDDEKLPKLMSKEEISEILFLSVRGFDYSSIHTNVGNHINVEA